MNALTRTFTFPDVVNETAARLVAGFVACSAAAVIAFDLHALLPLLAFGFLLRVLAGPKLSPLAILVVRVLVPRLGLPVKPVAGAPKRFAQGIGLAVTSVASALAFGGFLVAADALLGVLVVFATLEAALGFCAGCWLYGLFARPECAECGRAP